MYVGDRIRAALTKWKEDLPGSALASMFVGAAFLSALTKIRDTETWLHLSLGRIIWQMKNVPDVEVFTYPTMGNPFSYNSWLFGLLTYALEANFGVYALGIMKATIIAGAFYIFLKDSVRPHRNYVIAIMVLTVVMVFSHYRFVMRPDMFLMLYLGFSIFSLNAYLYSGKKYLYALPIVHLLWANMHASVILMFVPFGAFIAGSIIHRYIGKRGLGEGTSLSNSQLKVVTIVFVTSFIATLITPYLSFHQYIYGPKYVTSYWHKEYIQEMLPPTGLDRSILSVAAAIALSSFVLRWKRLSIIHLLLLVPFIVVSFVSLRFKFLLFMTAGPIVARNLSAFVEGRNWNAFFSKKSMTLAAAGCIILYLVLWVGQVGPNNLWARATFGFGFDYTDMPKGAIEYMDKKKIFGRMLNTFHFGQYITWTGYPERQVILDARGHLPPELLEKIQHFTDADFILDELYSQFGFQTILAELLDRDRPHSHPGWALVYWDDNSLIYLKRGGPYDHLISEDEYRHVNPDVGFGQYLVFVDDKVDTIRELSRNIRETNSSRARVLLGILYNSMGLYGEAIDSLSQVGPERPELKYAADVTIGDAYRNLGNAENSIRFYREAFALRENPAVLYKIALSYKLSGDNKETIKYIRKALSMKEEMDYAYPVLIEAYLALGDSKMADQAKTEYSTLQTKLAVKKHLDAGSRAYFDRRFDIATMEFGQAIEGDPTDASAYADLGYVYFQMGQYIMASENFGKALALDPAKANAKNIQLPNVHFGLAMIYMKTGETYKAKKHLEEFLDVEDSGHFSREAERLLKELNRQGS